MPRIRVTVGLLLCTLAWGQKKPVTLADVGTLNPEFEAVVWAPDGKRFLYEQKDSLWIYEIRNQSRRDLLALKELAARAVKGSNPGLSEWKNRHVREAKFAWSAKGDRILVSVEGDLFLKPFPKGDLLQLTATAEPERDPKLSPDGTRVAFRRGHDLYVLEIAGQKIVRLTSDGSATLWNGELDWVYPEELDLGTAYWWSSDSQRIAYLQFDVSRTPVYPQVDLLGAKGKLEPQRYPKAGDPNADVRAGVVSRDGGPTRWMNTGDPRHRLMARVQWMPDSRRLAIQCLNRIQNRLDLLDTDALSGESSIVVTEEDPHWVNLQGEPHFFRDGERFVWLSERGGFRHLYLYEKRHKGWQSKALTRGEWEVTGLAGVDERRGWVYYVSNQASPLEKRLYRVKTDGGQPEPLTAEAGVHAISMSPVFEHFLDTASSLSTPHRRTLRHADGRPIAVQKEADRAGLDAFEILPTEIVKVTTADGALLYGRMIKPAGFDPKKNYPAIVQVYGGPHGQAVRDAWAGLTWDQAMAHRGFLIWQLDNRGTSGRGHAFETPVFRNLGSQELKDQLEGLRYLENTGFVDMKRVGMNGWSYGGYLTLYCLTHAPDRFRAGIAGAPVTDWRNYDTIYTERYMGLPEENREGYKASSPISKAGDLTASLLLIHNFEDDNVHFQNVLQMADALQRAGKMFQMMVYPQKAHNVTGEANKQMLRLTAEFFETHLK
ncbi:MAG: S9 family peptidase [Bryobacteraceae bacterium]